MAGIWVTEGKQVAANLILNHVDANRGTSISLGLFTNASGLSAASTLASITAPSGGGYAAISLTDGSWTIVNGLATYATQTFTATTPGYTGTVYGYYLFTTGTTPKLLAYEINSVYGPMVMSTGSNYLVAPSIPVG